MYGWLTFYHQGYEVFKDCSPYMKDLQVRVQRVRTDGDGLEKVLGIPSRS